jgi:hypothetical protein
MPKQPTAAARAARDHLKKHPLATARELADKFKLDTSSIYRAQWWKDHQAAQKEQAK